MAKLTKKCPCGLMIYNIYPSNFKRKTFCSKVCMYKYRVYSANSGQYKKGYRVSVSTEFKSEKTIGNRNINWKGDNVGYFGLHTWVQRTLGKAKECSSCHKTKGRIEWANKSHKYIRDKFDWIQLCKKCHAIYDKDYWGLATKMFNLNKICV